MIVSFNKVHLMVIKANNFQYFADAQDVQPLEADEKQVGS